MEDLEARIQQSKQDIMVHNQEAAQLHGDLKDAKAKWPEVHDVVTAAECKSIFMEHVKNLEAKLFSKTEKSHVAEERRAKIEERLKRFMEQNRLHLTTNIEHDSKISTTKAKNEKLQSKIYKIREKLQDQEDSSVFEKTYTIYHTKMNTLEEAKEGIANINDCIAKA
ncbi:uncharacterized protein [Nicotiana sylvestris]|uniref:uncharacterized protein n=1 Tax=Nicotiana sylvestris TaxID=4096 RepID=UPI00388C7A37